MSTKHYVNDDETSVYVNFDGNLTTALFIGPADEPVFYARGHAKLAEPDVYDRRFGEALAVARARSRYYRKLERKLVRSRA